MMMSRGDAPARERFKTEGTATPHGFMLSSYIYVQVLLLSEPGWAVNG